MEKNIANFLLLRKIESHYYFFNYATDCYPNTNLNLFVTLQLRTFSFKGKNRQIINWVFFLKIRTEIKLLCSQTQSKSNKNEDSHPKRIWPLWKKHMVPRKERYYPTQFCGRGRKEWVIEYEWKRKISFIFWNQSFGVFDHMEEADWIWFHAKERFPFPYALGLNVSEAVQQWEYIILYCWYKQQNF